LKIRGNNNIRTSYPSKKGERMWIECDWEPGGVMG
jgi:hypothetical protein